MLVGMSKHSEHRALARLRAVARRLPETEEFETWDHPTFRVATKIFATFGLHEGHAVISVKQTKTQQAEWIQDPRFFVASYVGRFGWITLYADDVEQETTEALVLDSYRQVAPKRLVKLLDAP